MRRITCSECALTPTGLDSGFDGDSGHVQLVVDVLDEDGMSLVI